MKKKLEVMMTSVNVGRKKVSMKVSAELLGIKSKDPVIQKFIDEHVEFGKINFLPKEIEKELRTIESRIRMNHTRQAVKYNWGETKLDFMTIEVAEKFEKEIVEECKKSYFDKLNEIIKDYQNIKKDFLSAFEKFLSTNKEKKKFYDEMQSKIPVEVDYENKFYMSFNVKKMDITDDQDVINSFLAKAIKVIHDGAILLEKSYNKNKKIASKTMGCIKEIKEKSNELNLTEDIKISKILEHFDKIEEYKGRGPYTFDAINSIKKDCIEVANKLGVFDLTFLS